VNTIDEFIALLRDEMGMPLTAHDAARNLDEVAGWDSVHLLTLLTVVERRTGRNLPLADVLEAGSLRDIYELAVAA
jgi:acyl carrier protein